MSDHSRLLSLRNCTIPPLLYASMIGNSSFARPRSIVSLSRYRPLAYATAEKLFTGLVGVNPRLGDFQEFDDVGDETLREFFSVY